MRRLSIFSISFLLFGVASASSSNSDSFGVPNNDGFDIGTAVVTQSCFNGDIGVDSSGFMVSCESGRWSKASADVPSGTSCGFYAISDNWRKAPTVNLPCDKVSVRDGCPSGYTRVQRVERETGYSVAITVRSYWCVKS